VTHAVQAGVPETFASTVTVTVAGTSDRRNMAHAPLTLTRSRRSIWDDTGAGPGRGRRRRWRRWGSGWEAGDDDGGGGGDEDDDDDDDGHGNGHGHGGGRH
jgi:hypothetical protein